jgi:hypothetical protein
MPWAGQWAGRWAGGAFVGMFAFSAVRAVGARAVRVTFTREPLFLSPIGRYDAGNAQRWSVVRQDTQREISLLGVRSVPGDPFSVELLLSEPFASSSLVVYEVTGSQIHDATGLTLVDPSSAEISGMPAIREVIERPRPLLDLYNPQVDRQALRGALQVGTDGDYVLEGGESLLRKLIVRRLLTVLDTYYHLAGSGYGAGLQVKNLIRPSDLVVLRTQLENEVAREPEVASARVALSLSAVGRLDISVALTLRTTGQQITLDVSVSSTLSQ